MDKTTSALSNGPILHPSKTELWTASLRKLEMLENGLSGVQRLDDLRRRQVLAWERGERLLVEALIADTTQPLTDDELLELIYAEVMLRAERGEVCATDEYVQRFPQFAESLQRLFAIHEALEAPASEPSEAVQPPQVNRPQISDVPRSSDRNLLFGIVALQMDFISRDALIEALRDWTTQKDKPLGEILVERGDLSAARRELLEPLVDEHVRRHDDDPAASLASISSVSEGTLNWHRVHDVDIAESLAVRRLNRGTRLPEGASASGHRATAAGAVRFRVLRPHSEGGLGCVLVALDEELHREVALKEIKPQFAKDLASRNRFTLEAEITGGLEHPGIVPVYGLGQYSDGRPYYAMRFIRGDSLKEAIERFHTGQHSQAAESKPVPSDVNADTVIGTRTMSAVTLPAEIPPRPVSAVDYASVEFRKLLGRFIDVCQAIEYAHSRGVLHRDLKPGNIMLGKYGETLVVDWGLAKVAGKEDRFANVDEATLVPSSGSSIENTAAGSVIGTPAYMSPEQAAGRLQQLGPATDVYSLGATLYHVLTGRSPFDKLPLPELLARVQCGEFPRPDEINARIPRALAAVCLRAMALQPTHRYQSAADIAEDLEHWLADEPVNAHREGPLARGARWVRKRRAWAMSGAAALALIAVVSSVAAVWINSERKTADSERQNAIVARAKAEAATNESLTMLADMQTERGLQFGREDDSATAASWFANAALLTPHDRKRQAANRLRARNWMNDAIVPAALLKLPNGPLRRIAFQPAGPLLLTLNATSLQIWDWRYEQALAWTESLADVTDAGWSPDGKQLAVAFGSGDVQVCEPTSGTVLRRFKHPERVESLLWSPDGQRVAVAGSRVQIWNVTEEPKCEYDWPHPNKVNALIFNQSGDRLATACEDNQARLFAVSDVPGQPAPLFAPVVHSPLNRCAPAFCQGDHQLVTVVRGGQPRWWEVDTGRDVTPEITVSKDSFDRKLVSSPDGQWIFAGGGNSCLVWNADGNSFALEHGNHVQDVAFDPQRSVLMTTCWDGKARLWTMPPSGRSPVTLPQMETYPGCALSTDGSFAAIAGASQVVIWQLRQQEVVVGYVEGWTDSRWLPRPGFDGRMATPGAWHGDPWGFQPRGNTLAVARMASGQPAGPPISLNGSLYDSCLCADNRSVAAACVAGQSGILSVFDVATGSPNFPPVRPRR